MLIIVNFIVLKNSLNIWFSLSRIDFKSGPLKLKQGSHILGLLPRRHVKNKFGRRILTIDNKYINDTRFKEIIIETKPGDAIIFDLSLLHASGNNTSKDQVKFSCQGRYHNYFHKNYLKDFNL